MKIIQLLPTFSYGDAIGNDCLAMLDIILSLNYESAIYAKHIDTRLQSKYVFSYSELPDMLPDDILIYHMSVGDKMSYEIPRLTCRKIMVYHNITPPEFFKEYDNAAYFSCKDGMEQVRFLADKFDYCLAVSDYNKQQLLENGYKCPIDVLPIVIPFEDYEKKPSQKIINKYSDGKTNLMFLGRIAPNKKQEDVISAFYCYKKNYDLSARLFMVGSLTIESYDSRLKEYVRRLGLDDVYFTGQVKFDEILAYYRIADAFVCMSEHEGFCVPLIESMFFGVPIIAFDAAAISYTLNGSGVLLNSKEPALVAGVIDKVLKDSELRLRIVENQKKQLDNFSHERVKRQFLEYLVGFIGDKQ